MAARQCCGSTLLTLSRETETLLPPRLLPLPAPAWAALCRVVRLLGSPSPFSAHLPMPLLALPHMRLLTTGALPLHVILFTAGTSAPTCPPCRAAEAADGGGAGFARSFNAQLAAADLTLPDCAVPPQLAPRSGNAAATSPVGACYWPHRRRWRQMLPACGIGATGSSWQNHIRCTRLGSWLRWRAGAVPSSTWQHALKASLAPRAGWCRARHDARRHVHRRRYCGRPCPGPGAAARGAPRRRRPAGRRPGG